MDLRGKISQLLAPTANWISKGFRFFKINPSNRYRYLIKFVLSRPIALLSLFTRKNVDTFIYALKNEEPDHLMKNLIGLLRDHIFSFNSFYGNLDNSLVEYRKLKKRSSSGSILFISQDARLAGSQLLLKYLMEWILKFTSLDFKLICIEGGVLLPEFERLCPVIVWNEFYKQNRNGKARAKKLENFCEHIDLIYGNTCVVAHLYSQLTLLEAPILTHVHEMEDNIQKNIPSKTIQSMKRYTSAYIACSTPVENYLFDNNFIQKKPFTKIYSFVDNYGSPIKKYDKNSLRKKLKMKEDVFTVIGCGSIGWRKGTDLFIDTVIKLRNKLKVDFHFYWIGENLWNKRKMNKLQEWGSIQNRIVENTADDFITFLGQKQNPRDYFSAADVFYLSSREDPFPLVCLEAAQCRLPIVCFDKAGGMPEFVGNNSGFVLPYENTDEAAEILAYLARNKTIRDNLGRQARKNQLNKFTVDIAAPKILEFIGNVSSIYFN